MRGCITKSPWPYTVYNLYWKILLNYKNATYKPSLYGDFCTVKFKNKKRITDWNMFDHFRYCVAHEWGFASQKDTIRPRYRKRNNLRVFLLFPLFTEHNCAVIDVRVPAAQWSPRRNRSNQSDLVIPSPSAYGELLLIRPDHGPRAYPHTARDASSLKGAADPGEWRMRDPTGEGVYDSGRLKPH